MAKLIGSAPNQISTNGDLGKMAFEDKVSVANINATGTKDATTFLRGDNTFAVPTDNGKVLQVVSSDSAVNRTTTSTSFVGSGVSVSITPSSASNKILIMCNTGSMDFFGTASTITVALYKNAAELKKFSAVSFGGGEVGSRSLVYLDSPATTSSISYEIYFKSGNASQTAYLNEGGDGVVSIVAMEIAG